METIFTWGKWVYLIKYLSNGALVQAFGNLRGHTFVTSSASLCLSFSLAFFPLLLLHPHWHVPLLVWTTLLSFSISIHSNSFSWFSTTHYVFFSVSLGR